MLWHLSKIYNGCFAQEPKKALFHAQTEARAWARKDSLPEGRTPLGCYRDLCAAVLAMLFMLEERIRQQASYPLLSCADIVRLLAEFLPRQDRTKEDLIRQMEVRHRKRQASIDSAYRKQAIADALPADG